MNRWLFLGFVGMVAAASLTESWVAIAWLVPAFFAAVFCGALWAMRSPWAALAGVVCLISLAESFRVERLERGDHGAAAEEGVHP